jgi:hypothetical protein
MPLLIFLAACLIFGLGPVLYAIAGAFLVCFVGAAVLTGIFLRIVQIISGV